MEILSTIWQLIQILLLTAVILGSLALLVALLHPLRFDVRLRATPGGQRGEVWFVYLFRLFKIGIIATPRTQDVVIGFFGWEKRLERMGRRQAARPSTPTEPPPSPSSQASPPASTVPAESAEPTAPPPPEKSVEVKDVKPPETAPEEKRPVSSDAFLSTDSSIDAKTDEPETPSDATDIDKQPDSAQPTLDNAAQPAVTPRREETEKPDDSSAEAVTKPDQPDTRPLKPIDQVAEEYRAREKADTETKTPEKERSSLRQSLRKFKRDASRRFNQIKSYARLGRCKWRALSPVLQRFWQRGKKGFALPRADLLLRYALHEPYLTGMSHATLAVASGMAGQFGVNFVPIPHFGAPMLYSRAYVTAVIKPWRMVFAVTALLFEKQLYYELWQLFKLYRNKKQH